VDNQVKVRGFRIELGEVEAALNALPGIASATVMVRHDLPGGTALAAYLVAEDARQSPQQADIRRQLLERLPDFMVPGFITLLDKLPLTPAGKIDRQALPKPALISASGATYVAPRTATEQKLVELWQGLLPVERIGVLDSFFDLGGQSILGVRLMARISQTFGVALPITELLNHRTIERLAERIDQRADGASEYAPLVVLRPGEGVPLYCIHPIGGDVLCYQPLADRLQQTGPILGVRSRGFHGEPVFASREALLDTYTQAIIADARGRPVRLLAQSLGGVLALLLAERLVQAGVGVQWISLLDTYTPDAMASLASTDVEVIEMALGSPLPAAVRALAQQQDARWLDQLYDLARQAGVLPGDFRLEDLKAVYRVAMANQSWVANDECAAQISRLCGPLWSICPVYHFEASERRRDTGSAQGWLELGAPFQFESVQGNHESILRLPAVQALVVRLEVLGGV
jgi:thioesterase domain-containing protein/acyl carrier protein